MSRGCYICRPDDPKASPEGCSDCERRYVSEYVIPAKAAKGTITIAGAAKLLEELNAQ